MHVRILAIALLFLLSGCFPEKSKLPSFGDEENNVFPKTINSFYTSNLEGKIFAVIVDASPISDSNFADCYRFDSIVNNKLSWASSLFNFRESWGDDLLGSHINSVGSFFPLNQEKNAVSENYFITYVSFKDDYYDDKKAWGPLANFVFPSTDFGNLNGTLAGAIYAQLVVFRTDSSPVGDTPARLEVNFGSSGYAVKVANSNPTKSELTDIARVLVERNKSFVEGGIFAVRWVDFFEIEDFDDELESSTLMCGETDDANLTTFHKEK